MDFLNLRLWTPKTILKHPGTIFGFGGHFPKKVPKNFTYVEVDVSYVAGSLLGFCLFFCFVHVAVISLML